MKKILALTLIIIAAAAISAYPQTLPKKIDLGKFIKEIMIINVEDNQSCSAIWIPYQFHTAAAMSNKADRQQLENELNFWKPYIPIIVQCSIDKPDGSKLYAAEQQIKISAYLTAKDKSRIAPLTEIPEQLAKRLDVLKQMMAPPGKSSNTNMHILVFANKDKTGQPIINSDKKDKLELTIEPGGLFKRTKFQWHTPFDAVSAKVNCPICRKHCSAKWWFCPWCGKKL